MFESEILVQKPEEEDLHLVNPGSIYDEITEIEAGTEIEIKVFTNFKEADLLPHDWSLVVWSDKEPIEIRHKDGIESGSFFNLELAPEVPIPSNFTDSGNATFGPIGLTNAIV